MNVTRSALAASIFAVAASGATAHSQETPNEGDCPAGFDVTEAKLPDFLDEPPQAEVQDEVSLRAGPGTACDGEYFIPAAATVEVIGCRMDWCKVTYATETGYVPVAAIDPVPDRAPDLPEE